MIVDAEGSQMSLEEAKKYRLEFEDERAAFVELNDEEYFQINFNRIESQTILSETRAAYLLGNI